MEKEKCHCKNNEMFEDFSCDAEIKVSKSNHLEIKTWVNPYTAYAESVSLYIKIKFCPFCGKDLQK